MFLILLSVFAYALINRFLPTKKFAAYLRNKISLSESLNEQHSHSKTPYGFSYVYFLDILFS